MPSTRVSETWQILGSLPRDLDLFALPGLEPFALLYGDGRWAVFGEGPLAVLEEPDPSGFVFRRRGEIPPLLPDFIGFATYDWGCGLDPLMPAPRPADLPFPAFHFTLFRRVLVLDRQEERVYEALRSGIDAPPRRNALRPGPFRARQAGDSDTPAGYEAKVARVREEIARGNVYQANLTRQETWTCEGDLRHFARALHARNPAPFSAFMAGEAFVVVSSSPERFVQRRGDRLVVRPIKGTAPRGRDAAEDAALAAELLASPKNNAELAMIVDLLRNDLTRACETPSVRVEAFPELETYANVHHLVGTVSGKARADLTLRGLLEALFPGGSITGCPKLAAMALIRELEPLPRQLYTGALGWFTHDLSGLDLNIAIRTAFGDGRTLRFGVGGGVVWESDPRSEYLETVHKGASLRACLASFGG
ncbi:MAG TPA: anthranilate synthase component I family protein [Holophaga sp.]|nr:anthranilate synthase component I family protein [Holophaga sp.]